MYEKVQQGKATWSILAIDDQQYNRLIMDRIIGLLFKSKVMLEV